MIVGNFLHKLGYIFAALMILYLVNPSNLDIYIGYLLTVFIFIQKDFLLKNIDGFSILLFLFSLIYGLFFYLGDSSASVGKLYVVVYITIPGTFYLLGKYACTQFQSKDIELFYLLFFIGTIFSITSILSVLPNILEAGFVVIDRNLPNFWTGGIIPATIMGSYFIFNMCIPAILVTQVKNFKLIYRILALILFAISVACVLRIGSRTQLLISLVTLLVSLIYIIPRQSFKRNIITFALFGLLIFGIISNVNFDLDQDWLSAFAGRMENDGAADLASGGGRTERWVKSIQYLFEKPLGWERNEFGHAHNLWLDVLRIGGFIPFFMLILLTVKAFSYVRKAILKAKNAYAFNNQLIVYFSSFMLLFMVEPIFEGMFNLFAVFCFFIGVVKKYQTFQPYIT